MFVDEKRIYNRNQTYRSVFAWRKLNSYRTFGEVCRNPILALLICITEKLNRRLSRVFSAIISAPFSASLGMLYRHTAKTKPTPKWNARMSGHVIEVRELAIVPQGTPATLVKGSRARMTAQDKGRA